MAEDTRLRAVAGLARAMAAAQHARGEAGSGAGTGIGAGVDTGTASGAAPALPHREVARAAAECAREALSGSFAAVSAWERARGRLRVLANVGELAEGESGFPEDESYAVQDFPEIAGLTEDRWPAGPGAGPAESGGGGEPRAWIVTPDMGEPGESGEPRAARTHHDVRGAHDVRAATLRRRGRGCCVVAPIAPPQGRAWGELYVARAPGVPVFGPADAEFAAVLASVIGSGIAQSEQLEEVRKLAYTDQLTGLANRRAVDVRLAEGLERHRADGTVVSLVVCDVNGLKRVNDELGHEAGDHLLERFGTVLSLSGAALRGTLAARLGGDEFCLLAVGPDADEVVRAADEVCRRAGELLAGDGVACGVASTGDPIGPVRSAPRLFRLADAAQYRAKAARARKPVVAGRDSAGAGPSADPVVRLADAPVARLAGDRRRFRGSTAPDAGDDGGVPDSPTRH